MKIERVETFVVSLPERRAHVMASIKQKQGDYVIVRIEAEGLVGYGEATVLKEWGGDFGRYYGEHPSTTVTIINELLGPAIIGLDALSIETVLDRMDLAIRGYPYAKASVDIAVHDLVGKALGVPVYQLLGGAYRERIRLAHSLGWMDTAPLLKEVEAAVGEGVGTIKLKVGGDVSRDVDVVRQVRKLVGEGIDITVDANQGWPDVRTAVRAIKGMEEFGILFAEQPVEGLRGMAAVAAAVDTELMADESAWTSQDIVDIAQAQAARLISIYTTKPGGLRRATKVAAVAEAYGFACNVNGSAETGVGNAANLHLAAAMKPISLATVIPVSAPAGNLPTSTVGRFYLDDIITEPFKYEHGELLVPTAPGLGIEVDEDKVRQYRR
ncbi:MAG TPA: enolase C-terminal domain-like protein [Solirubrobacteraceae bacterium]|jgi:muconate cycloisomerase|nr:enolase C-terminal domain-like protein [Solirubrobacteraceae bacterium]